MAQEGHPSFLFGRSLGTVSRLPVRLSFKIMPHFVYILRSQKDGSYYAGSAQDLVDRLKRHNQGRSKYTKFKRPWELVYSEECPDRSAAMKRERQIKNRKSRFYIESLVRTSRQS